MHDVDVPAAVLALAGADAVVVEVGTGADGEPLAHAARAKVAIDLAKDGGLVVRLLQGDPGLFGGVGEEAAACTRAKVPFEIVPGVSSVTAVPAYAGLPLTSSRQREVHVVDATAAGVDWTRHAHGGGTLVLLNALGVLGTVSAALVAAGRDPHTAGRGDEVGDDHRADHPGHDAGVRGRRRAGPAADRARGRRGR